MSTRKAQDLYKQSNRVILNEVMENDNKVEKCEKNKSTNFSQIIIEFIVLKDHNTLHFTMLNN